MCVCVCVCVTPIKTPGPFPEGTTIKLQLEGQELKDYIK